MITTWRWKTKDDNQEENEFTLHPVLGSSGRYYQ